MIPISASEPYDFLSTIAADVDVTLAPKAHGVITEEGFKNQIAHLADDNTEQRISLTSGSIFFIEFAWHQLSEAESGTIFDLYHDPAKANGIVNSFKCFNYDGHTYVVRFDGKLTRSGNAVSRWGYPVVRLRILGRIAD